MNIQKMKRLLGFPLDPEYRKPVERSLALYLNHMQRVLCPVILITQAVMMAIISLRDGGPFLKPRRAAYFWLYVILFAATAVFMLTAALARRKIPERTSTFLKVEAVYVAVVALWSCALTLNDQLGGNGISVYIYMMMTLAAFAVLKPWQAVAIFGGSGLLLNLLLPFFPSKLDNTFSDLTNSICVIILATIVSILFYRYRVFNCYDQMVIKRQYEEIRQINQQLNLEVMIDKLTQMNNRRYLEEIILQRVQDCWKQEKTAAGMMVDIDFFKSYNDHYGHQAGDVCLKNVARLLMRFAEEEQGSAVRYGGEEFFVCLFDCEGKAAMEKAEKLRSLVEKEQLLRDDIPMNCVTVSIGVCVSGEMDMEQFVHRTDQALYQAKEQGRNRVVILQP